MKELDPAPSGETEAFSGLLRSERHQTVPLRGTRCGTVGLEKWHSFDCDLRERYREARCRGRRNGETMNCLTRGPPQGDLHVDQTPALDPTDAESIPDFVFDQSLPDEFDN